MDIALLPEHRGRGIGAALIQGLFDEATHEGKAIRLYFEKLNRAQQLYRRMGFETIGDAGSHFFGAGHC